MVNQRTKLLIVTLILSLSLALVGCPKSGSSLTIANSNLKGQNLSKVPYSMNKITVNFNKEVTKAEAVVKENGKAITGVKASTSGQQAVISKLNLKPLNLYSLTLKATDKEGNQLTDQIEFITQAKTEVANTNPVLMQTFYWEMAKGKYAKNYPAEKTLWNLLKKRADDLAANGITAL